jgi:Ca2+-binding RTX toxin-like protein
MTLIVATNTNVPGVAYTLADGDSLRVDSSITVRSTAEVTIIAAFGGATITNNGYIGSSGDASDDAAIVFGNSQGATVGDRFNFTLNNSGIIASASSDAVRVYGQDLTVTNSGTIAGVWGIFQSNDVTGGLTQITNSGSISGQFGAIVVRNDDDARIVNTGFIQSLGNAVQNEDGRLALDNSGTIRGDVSCGGNADIYRAIGSGSVSGQIIMGNGDDTVYAGSAAEWVLGGTNVGPVTDTGIDTVIYNSTDGVQVALDFSVSGSGWARGDILVDVENLTGSAGGNDTLVGSAEDNLLRGRQGNDVLRGQDGADRLSGGSNTDTLTGGAGDDDFLFLSRTHFGDRITDFVSGDDAVLILDTAVAGSGLGLGSPTAGQFRSRADSNQAMDATDRFIFRNSDKTLWFDANGTGSGGPVMVADLQSGATLVRTDIVIYADGL